MGEVISAKLLAEVQWGIIPGQVDGNKQWAFTRDDVENAESWRTLLEDAYEEFNLRMNPEYHNWVTMTWLWL